MMTGKKILYAVLGMILLQACSVDDDSNPYEREGTQKHAICFSSDIETRAEEETPIYELLGEKFVVFGTKTMDKSTESVFGGVPVKYENNDWSYDELKEWDMTATQYRFAAYSVGKGDKTNDPATVAEGASIDGFTVSGSKEQLLACFFTDRKVVEKNDFEKTVDMKFNQLAAKVNLKFYSSIDGCTVKDFTFKLYTETAVIPTAGPYTVTYDSDNKAVLSHDPNSSNVASELMLTPLESGTTIGTSESEATSTGDCLVLPMSAPTTKLKIEVKYKTVDSDGTESNEIITKQGVIVNSIDWKYQHRYVYMLKITDKDITCIPYSTEEWDNDYRH